MTPSTPLDIPAALWAEVSAAFDAALDWPPVERVDRLAALEADRPDLAAPLRQLLAAQRRSGGLEPVGADLLQRALAEAAEPWVAGRVVGNYRLLAPLGEGGMSSVWMAEQMSGVQRRVALKLPRPGLEAPPELAARFARERDLLAALEHPHIARLYDAGVDDGQPWLAMAMVEGTHLTEHAAALPVRRRIGLFLQVLDAVRFAHARLVVHRDLKPANILVDRDGQVQLLDFGIARLLGDDDASASGAVALTPDSASPELLAGESQGVACDVYALGVVLYELLAGGRPYRLDPRSREPLAAQLARTTVLPPSRRSAEPLAPDLDAIVLRSMACRPEDRYASAEALASDLQAWLDRRPVQARGGGRRYRVGLAIRRNAGAVTGGVATVLALCVGLGSALWQARQAQAQAQRVEATQRWLVELFDAFSPDRAGDRSPDARQVVLEGSARLDAQLAAQPVQRADVQRLAGQLLLKMQDWPGAAERLQAAVDGYAALGRAQTPDALDALEGLAEALDEAARHDEALQVFDRLLVLAQAGHGDRNAWRRPVLVRQAGVRLNQGDAAGAETDVRTAMALPAGPGEDAPRTALNAAYTLALAHWHQGRNAESADGFQKVADDAPGVPGFPQSNLLNARYRLATAWGRAGEFERVLAASEPLLHDAESLLGPKATLTVHVAELRVQVLARLGRHADALTLQRDVVGRVQGRVSSDEQRALSAGMLGQMLVLNGRFDEGLPLLRAAVALLDERYPQASAFTEVWRLLLGQALLRAQDWPGARTELQATLVRAEAASAMDPSLPAESRQALALLAMVDGRLDEAGALLGVACPALVAVYGADSPRGWRCQVHEAWVSARRMQAGSGRQDPVDGALNAFDAAASRYRASLPADHVVGAELDWMRADLLALRDPAAAARLREQARAAWQRAMGRPMPARFTGLH